MHTTQNRATNGSLANAASFSCERCNGTAAEVTTIDLASGVNICFTCRSCNHAKMIVAPAPQSSLATPAAPRYGIRGDYTHRSSIAYFDDTDNTDAWQREVYVFARDLMRRHGLRRVYDIGCGGGFKLVNYLGEFETVGFDLPKTLEFLRATYPQRTWAHATFADRGLPASDLVLCSDVIEHVADPDELVAFIKAIDSKYVIFSTPDRDLVYPPGDPFRCGPPRNETHVREWNFREFNRYISQSFEIVHHIITNHEQATQMTVCLGSQDL